MDASNLSFKIHAELPTLLLVVIEEVIPACSF